MERKNPEKPCRKVYKDPKSLIDLGISFQSSKPLYEMAELFVVLILQKLP